MRLLHTGLALVLLAVCTGGCATESAGGRGGAFEVVGLDGAPAQVQRTYDRMKGVAGLYVVPVGQETFLLLCAGKTGEAGLAVEVLEVAWAPERKEARVLATLRNSSAAGEYPCTALKVEGARGVAFKARLNARDEGVIELQGLSIDEAVER